MLERQSTRTRRSAADRLLADLCGSNRRLLRSRQRAYIERLIGTIRRECHGRNLRLFLKLHMHGELGGNMLRTTIPEFCDVDAGE